MKKVVTAGQMQSIDRRAIDKYGIPGLVLMENAGRECAERIWQKYSAMPDGKILIFVGKGNNGGDGMVIARHLLNKGAEVRVFLLAKHSELKGDAKTHADAAFSMEAHIREVDESKLKYLDHSLRHCRIVVDALFGSGLTRPVEGIYEKVVDKINQFENYVVAVDIPSGIDSDSGQIMGPYIKADLTVALAQYKRSHLLHPAAEAMGEIQLADIGIPQGAVDEESVALYRVEESDVRPHFKKRRANSHKGSYGHALVVAGARGKCGAAGLAALAALRMGAGLVTLAVPESCLAGLEFNPLEVMTVGLPETPDGTLDVSAESALLTHCEGKSALALGPGLSTHPQTAALIKSILPKISCPMVIDADAINILADSQVVLSQLQAETVLTPHPKEFSRISGWSVEEILNSKIEKALEFSQEYTVGLLLKGAGSILACPSGAAYINSTGNPGMATGGSGDVLTGFIAGLLAQGFNVQDAALCGMYLHGLAGDVYAEENSEASLIAGDLLRTLPTAIKRILNQP